MGYDVHRLVTGRKLIVGGVDIPHEYGLLGHSDADVLLHAVEDALLGAAALGDLGRHFPDSDDRWKGVSSMKLLEHVAQMLRTKGYRVGNIDATIVAQRPKFAPYIAEKLDLELDQVNVKATTEEKLGFTGEEKGISAYAVASLERMEEK